MEQPSKGTKLLVQTSLVVGVQFSEFDFRLFLREYHKDLRQRFSFEGFPAYSPAIVLDTLMGRLEESCKQDEAGGRLVALRDYTQRAFRLQLGVTGTEYGKWEQRSSPYSFDRATYHLGREIARGELLMDYPGYNPYRSTRKLDIDFLRENIDDVLEFLPDYLWWATQDRRDQVRNVLSPEKLLEIERAIESSGFPLESFGLYLSTFEAIVHSEEEPA
ncbi:MAG: hypothetical protein VYE40_05315 [Myxococcota bacterium]|jgi:hypothetical protein|nr:hypothetical protein [Myxococcota bacterium]MEC9440510.1 hypothetical protein [Myxococcota bacterium]